MIYSVLISDWYQDRLIFIIIIMLIIIIIIHVKLIHWPSGIEWRSCASIYSDQVYKYGYYLHHMRIIIWFICNLLYRNQIIGVLLTESFFLLLLSQETDLFFSISIYSFNLFPFKLRQIFFFLCIFSPLSSVAEAAISQSKQWITEPAEHLWDELDKNVSGMNVSLKLLQKLWDVIRSSKAEPR